MPSLFRYFSKKHALAFVDKGEVLFRSLSYFRDYEDDGVRADPHEGTLVHVPENGLVVKKIETGEEISLPHRFESTAKEDDIFVYCMSTELSADTGRRFGAEVAVEVHKPLQFLAKLRASMALRKRLRVEKLVTQEVRYYEWHEPPIVDWALPERIAVRKPKSFEWQSEYRFVVPVGEAFRVENVAVNLVPVGTQRTLRATAHPQLLLKLGNLSKICRVHAL